jgi:ribosomal protein L11 methyltransferase
VKAPAAAAQSFWAVRLECPYSQCALFETALSDIAVAVSSYEVEEHVRPEAVWGVEVLFTEKPDVGVIASRIALAAKVNKLNEPAFRIEFVPARDWLTESYASFAPLRAGRFYIYGDHITDAPPPSVWPLRLNAATAFGSGEHESTFGCLLALSGLSKRRRPHGDLLDLGCGSGILALGMSKAWRRAVLAIDIDPEAVRVARLNAWRNQEHGFIRVTVADGLQAYALRGRGPFGVITANILARPLCKLAAGIAGRLAHNGYLILAGLLTRQEAMVLAAYRVQGLRLDKRIALNGWSTLVLRR